MARVGPEQWHCVSIDSAGVPHGGRFGHVDDFARKASQHGLTLCWSRFHNRFGLVTRRGTRWTWQCLLTKNQCGDGAPMYLNDNVLYYMLHWWDRYKTLNQALIAEKHNRANESRKRSLAEKAYRDLNDSRRDRFDKIALVNKWRGPKVFSGPAIGR